MKIMKEVKKFIYAILLCVGFVAISVGAQIGFCKIMNFSPTFDGITFGLVLSVIFLLCYGVVDAYCDVE